MPECKTPAGKNLLNFGSVKPMSTVDVQTNSLEADIGVPECKTPPGQNLLCSGRGKPASTIDVQTNTQETDTPLYLVKTTSPVERNTYTSETPAPCTTG